MGWSQPQPRAPKPRRGAHITSGYEKQRGFCPLGRQESARNPGALLKGQCTKPHPQPLTQGFGRMEHVGVMGRLSCVALGESCRDSRQGPCAELASLAGQGHWEFLFHVAHRCHLSWIYHLLHTASAWRNALALYSTSLLPRPQSSHPAAWTCGVDFLGGLLRMNSRGVRDLIV